jgi:hypothetical protein
VIAACLAKPFTGKRLILLLYWQVQLDVPQSVSLCHHDMRASMRLLATETNDDGLVRAAQVRRPHHRFGHDITAWSAEPSSSPGNKTSTA